jgi:excisionase family DNA binding protein
VSERPQRPESLPGLWTVTEVAAFLQLHPKSIYDLVARGSLPCVRLGTRLRFDPRDIASWVSARKEG